MLKIITTAIALFCCTFYSCCQVNDFTKTPDAKIFKQVNTGGWVKFQDSLDANALQLFSKHPKTFGLSNEYSMQLKKTNKDEIGFIHSKFQQYYNGLPITGAEFLLQEKNGRLYSGNGKIYTPSIISSRIVFSETAALENALAKISSQKGYYWQDIKRETALKRKTGNMAATYFPKATMEYLPVNNNNSLVLCYRFLIQAFDFGKSCYCFVNAGTGKIEKQYAIEYSCSLATFTSNYDGGQIIYTKNNGLGYDLEDDCENSIYTVYNVYDLFNNSFIMNTGNDNVWSTDKNRSGATSLWVIKTSRNLYKAFFGRNGHDNNDGDLDIYQGYNFGTVASPNNYNASYHYDPIGTDEINVGVGDEPRVTDDWNCLDILGHEFTHGVTHSEAGLVYEKEPGALNESFSDIFGEWVENKVRGSNDWYNGLDMLGSGGCPLPLRSFIDPAAQNVSLGAPGFCVHDFTQPNTYHGLFWTITDPCTPDGTLTSPTYNDACGVHHNSGVQNQMFYLLCMGGAGWRNAADCHTVPGTGTQWSLTGIGMDKAIKIAYRVLCDYLGSQSGYLDARQAWVHAAADLYGECSFEAIQTGKAWNIVGIPPPALSAYDVCGLYGGSPYYLTKYEQINVAASCAVSILPLNSPVQFQSGTRVILYPGFTAYEGSQFSAVVADDCWYAAY